MQGNLFAAAVRQAKKVVPDNLETPIPVDPGHTPRPQDRPSDAVAPERGMDRGSPEPTAAELAAVDLPQHLPPPLLYIGPAQCGECGRGYIEAWWDLDLFVRENRSRGLFPRPKPGQSAADLEAQQRRRHQALLTKVGAEPCPRHCGWALVALGPDRNPQDLAGLSRNEAETKGGEDEEEGEED